MGLKILWQNAGHYWAFIQAEKAFLSNALSGMVMSISLAFLILVGATRNILIAAYAILTVIFICSSVVAMMVFKGW